MTDLNSYNLSRSWFDFAFQNPEKISPNHAAIYFFAIEHCNRLGWKEKFGFPTQMAMDAIGIKKHHTYIKYFNDLVEWGFFILVQKSTNQYSANIISLKSAMPKNGKALGKAIATHAAKQTQSNGQSTGQSIGCIDKPDNQEPINIETENKNFVFGIPSETTPMFILTSNYTTGNNYTVHGEEGYYKLVESKGLRVPAHEKQYVKPFMREKDGTMFKGDVDFVINSFKNYINNLYKN